MTKHYIYYIYHISKKRYYVGETSNYIERFKSHMKRGERGYDTIDNLYKKRGLYLAMHKYGITDFAFKVIEICTYDERYKREAYWICKLKSHEENGYNSIVGINGVALKSMMDNSKLNLKVQDCKVILAKKNNLPYIEVSNHIDEDLVDYAIRLKQYIHENLQNAYKEIDYSELNRDKSGKCRSGFTNIYILKDKSKDKVYIGTSQFNSSIKVLENIIVKIKNYNPKTMSGGFYEYLSSIEEMNSLQLSIIENNIYSKTLTNKYKYNILVNQGYCIDDLMSNKQREQFSEI